MDALSLGAADDVHDLGPGHAASIRYRLRPW
jgi:hypothetical protein